MFDTALLSDARRASTTSFVARCLNKGGDVGDDALAVK